MRSFIHLLFLAGILTGIPAFFSGCDRLPGRGPVAPRDYHPAVPGRDEVALSGDYRLSLVAYDALKQAFPELKPEDRVRVGLYAQWLIEETDLSQLTAAGGGPPSIADAARCIRILFLPKPRAIDTETALKTLSSSFGISSQENLQKKVHDAWGNRVLEWNPSLRRDLGISP